VSDSKQSTCIKCIFHTKKKRDFYIDESQTVWPCCHYANLGINEDGVDQLYKLDRKLWQSLKDNPDWNKISKNDIESILSNEIYAHDIYFPGWETTPTKACAKFCGGEEKVSSNMLRGDYVND